MNVEPMIRSVFGPFQNLNLLVLLEDLRRGRTAQGDWAYRDQLCPVAHGLASGRLVSDLETVDQTVSLGRACDLAARHLGADPASVYRFVRYWDNEAFSPTWLLHQLEALWEERRADADAVQEMLQRTAPTGVPSGEKVAAAGHHRSYPGVGPDRWVTARRSGPRAVSHRDRSRCHRSRRRPGRRRR